MPDFIATHELDHVIDHSSKTSMRISVILPARDEARSLTAVVQGIRVVLPDVEVIVVDDGSSDDTAAICAAASVSCVRHPYPKGNGAAVKTGARVARGDILVLMDADGQHDPKDVLRLLETLQEGHDMVVGARGSDSQAGAHRAIANAVYNRFASWMVGHPIEDLTSGFRAVRAARFKKFLYLLPNGFSYPTTITMCFFRAGYTVAYTPIQVKKRIGRSHIRIGRDGLRFLLIIFRVGTLYSPLKLFLPVSMSFFFAALGYYAYTFFTWGRFTNMTALLFSVSVIIFMIGLVSEQITALNFRDSEK